ncbi:MAG: hypothetical protein JXJ18_01340 [Rhodobacteraceae bacterium]|nr:hypothetical protein [Paracoccaceae bacterium]
MMNGPGKGELRLRLGLSLAGLALVLVAGIARGMDGAATVEVLGVAGFFFGGTALISARGLSRREHK